MLEDDPEQAAGRSATGGYRDQACMKRLESVRASNVTRVTG